ncbi:nucleotidyltransferase family protein [Dehalococcoidia bacterium]|nr:nucleotidyltransferase family protein [Dehalococcoidia bacterium]
MKTLKEIEKILATHEEELRIKYKIKEIGIFGSLVRGEQGKRSDIDILVDFSELPDVFLLTDLEDYLKSILKTKVDVVRKGAIRPELRDVILEEAVFL